MNYYRRKLSKKTIELEIFQCDHVSDNSERCTNENDKDAIKRCHICHMDLCKTHCQIITVVFLRAGGNVSDHLLQGTRLRFLYYFCKEHSDLFQDTVIKRYGEGTYIPNVGGGTSLI